MRKKSLVVLLFFFLTTLSQAQYFPQRINYLRFVENKGQWDKHIRYKSDIPSGELVVQDDFLGYIFWDAQQYAAALAHNHDGHEFDLEDDHRVASHAFKVKFLNLPKENTTLSYEGKRSDGVSRNYFKGNKRAARTKAYSEITYQNLYEGIDLRLFESQGALKYEFIVAPKQSPTPIALEYEGVQDVFITKTGELNIKTSVNTLKEAAPFAYQDIKGKRVEVACSFQLEGNVLRFALGKYNKRYPLVIDPQLIFSTYSGSTADNWGNTACLDKAGNLYTGGTIFSTDNGTFGNTNLNGFPATLGAFQTSFRGGDTDIGILKFDSSGTNLLYATYIGGNDAEIPTSTITNDNGELFILGITGSTNFPGAVNSFAGGTATVPVGGYSFNNGTDLIVIHLSANGDAILHARYVGGSNNDGLLSNNMVLRNNYGDQLRGDINIDAQSNVYVASTTSSSDFPIQNAQQSTYGGGLSDAVYFKLKADFSDFDFISYYGGNDEDAGLAIVRDTLNNVIVAGGTLSQDLVLQDSLSGYDNLGDADGFVIKVANDGSTLLHSTKLGTPNFDQVYFIQTDDELNLYVLGQTKGNYPVTAGVYSNPNEGIFIHKFGANFDTTYYSTVVGDEDVSPTVIPNFSPTAFLVNECQNLFIAGWGGRTNNGNSSYSLDPTNGTHNIYSTGIFPFAGGRFDLIAYSLSEAVPANTGDYDTLANGSLSYNPGSGRFDGVFEVFYNPGLGQYELSVSGIFGLASSGSGQFSFSRGYNGGFTFNMPLTPNAYQSTTDGSDFYMMVLHKNADSLLYATYFGGPTSSEHVDGGTSRFDDQGIVYQSVCAGCGGNNDFPLFPAPDGNPNTYPKPNRSDNCNNGVFKFDLASLTAAFTATQICDSLVVNFTNQTIGGVDFHWDFGDGTDTITYNRVHVSHRYKNPGTYRVRLEATDLTTCKGKDSAFVTIQLRPPFLAESFADTICQGDSVQLDVTAAGPGFSYEWFPVKGFPGSNIKNPLAYPDTNTVYTVRVTDDRGCSKVDTFTVRTLQVLDSIHAFVIGSCKALPTVKFVSSYEYEEQSKYYWEFSDGFKTTEPSFEHQFKGAGTYWVRKKVENRSCLFEDQSTITVEGIVIPNIFTPNNDAHNETFEITGIKETGNWKLEVYNRWGKRIHLDESYDNDWSAQEISDGTYYYLVTAPDGTQCKGWVQITR